MTIKLKLWNTVITARSIPAIGLAAILEGGGRGLLIGPFMITAARLEF